MNVANMQAIALDQFVQGIINRVAASDFEDTLQYAIAGVLSGLSDEKQADLYARIVTRWATCGGLWSTHRVTILREELNRTNLWENE